MEGFPRQSRDVEKGNNNNGQLYPGMMESPQMRWAFIRKVYVLLCMQLLCSFAVGMVLFFNPTIKHFMITNPVGWVVVLVACILTVITSLLMSCFSKKHPWNYVFALLFNLSMSFMIGVLCAYKSAKRGHDFSFLGPFLLCALLVLVAFGIIRILFPLGRLGSLIAGCASALVFSGFLIYDTDNLIKRFDYDEYLLAASALYSDIINLFLAFLSILDGE